MITKLIYGQIASLILMVYIDLSVAVAGYDNIERKDIVEGNKLGFADFKEYKDLEKECLEVCNKTKECKAFSLNLMNQTDINCTFYEKYVGYEKPTNEYEFNYYTKKRGKDDGFYRLDKKYMKLFYDDTLTYYDAKGSCEEEGGWLSSMDSEEAYTKALKEMETRFLVTSWIGFIDESNGDWKDQNGLNVKLEERRRVWNSTDKKCSVLFYGGRDDSGWNHQDCGNHHYRFCDLPLFD